VHKLLIVGNRDVRLSSEVREQLRRVMERAWLFEPHVRAVARPRPIFRLSDEAGRYGVVWDVPSGLEEVLVVDDLDGFEAVLPERTLRSALAFRLRVRRKSAESRGESGSG
jgi:hypothetical protein